MNRNLCDIIEQIYQKIPENNVEKDIKIRKCLDDLLNSMSYSAPEKILSNHFWVHLEIIINECINLSDYNDTNNPHYKEIVDIFTGKK